MFSKTPRAIRRSWLGKNLGLLVPLTLAVMGMGLPLQAQTGTWTLLNQVGQKLVSSGPSAGSSQGSGVAISADGRTALVGVQGDNSGVGGALVYTQSGGVWTQQGPVLVGTGAVGSAQQGWWVALSADGNTAAVGGNNDNGGVGAVWVFTRADGVWTQQGDKLVGSGGSSGSQGWSIALSVDGSTLIEGGALNNDGEGAFWVFVRSAGVWTQQAGPLLGTGEQGYPGQGTAVAISADGNTAVETGSNDQDVIGAAWVFTRSAGAWTQQGDKLVGTGNTGATFEGVSVSMSADGNTFVMGGPADDEGGIGAIWVFTRSAGAWTQQGNKLVGTGATGGAAQGASVGLSADGNTLFEGGPADNGGIGGIWEFTRTSGAWSQLGGELIGTGYAGQPSQGALIGVSATGGTLIEAGPSDNSSNGAVWIFGNNTQFPAIDVGTNTVQTISPFFAGSFTLGSIRVVTQGSQNLNFTLASSQPSSNACTVSTLYNSQSCSVNIKFLPTAIGQRQGAILFFDNQETPVLQATVYIAGVGLGAQLGFTSGVISTFAGNGTAGYAGDGGPAGGAEFNFPFGLTRDGAGNFYLGDSSNAVVREIAASGTVTTFAGDGTQGISGIGGPATQAELTLPEGTVIDGAGNLYIADGDSSSVYKVDPVTGLISIVAGIPGPPGFSGMGGPATSAQLGFVIGLSVDEQGDLFIGDSYNGAVYEVNAKSGVINVVAGTPPTLGYSGDGGLATAAALSAPYSTVVDATGTLYISDLGTYVVRRVDGVTGIISTLAGNGTQGFSGDGGPATAAEMSIVAGVAVDAAGGIYITDSGNGAVRKVNAENGVIATIAGIGGSLGYSGDGGPATAAQLGLPVTPVLDNAGTLYFPDAFNAVVRAVGGAAPLHFAATNVGSSPAAQDVVISNNGNIPLTFTSIAASANFNLGGEDTSCSSTTSLAAGSSCVLGVQFAPTIAGALTGTITLTSNVPSYQIALTGTGQQGTSTASTTATALIVSPNPAEAAATVTLTATVSPTPTGSSLGSVSFYDGDTLLGTVSLGSAGTATFTTVSLDGGVHSLTAVYSGNSGFDGSASISIAETVNATYTITAPTAPVTVAQGGSVQVTVTVPPVGGAYNSLVTLSASGLPPGATASFNPPKVTPGASGAPTVMTIQLAAMAASAQPTRGNSPYRPWPLASFALMAGLCFAGCRSRRLGAHGRRMAMLAVLAGSMSWLAACNGGFTGPATTQPGAFVVTVTGTSGSLTASTKVTVVVQ